jgi:hypothetical protein
MQTIAVAGLLIGAVSAIAAILAAWFAWKAPTKSDLQRVEDNTAETSDQLDKVRSHIARVDEHLAEQRKRDLLASRAEKVAIEVRGNDGARGPFNIFFTLKDQDVIITSVQLYNQAGSTFGSATCQRSNSECFVATFDGDAVARWFSGCSEPSHARRLLRIRVRMKIDTQDVDRYIPVYLTSGTRPGQNPADLLTPVYILEGNC